MANELIDTVREQFGRVAYAHKTHEKMADQLQCQAKLSDWLEVILIAATSGTIVSTLFGTGPKATIIASCLGAASLLIAVFKLKFKPEVQAEAHRVCARKLWLIREQYINLISDLKAQSTSDDVARKERDRLTLTLSQVYEASPSTNSKAYEAARKALKVSEELTFSQKEIDQLLPESLRFS